MTYFALFLLTIVLWTSAADASVFSPETREFLHSFTSRGGGRQKPLDFVHRKLSKERGNDCAPVSECEICTGTLKEKESSCEKYGRVQRFECIQSDDYTEVVYRSCKRSREDEVFLMMQLQIFCFLIGSIALVNVRKLKTSSSSLFDQRKADRRLRKNSQEISTQDNGEIEFSSLVKQQNTEMEPLRPINVV
mmetsp:Transcript_32717/g.49308  ORF Transcript_32717/g.49308 Transcript_32717/m.49308 type:complete len:192 (-) Transcript_32717:1773-2348(-)